MPVTGLLETNALILNLFTLIFKTLTVLTRADVLQTSGRALLSRVVAFVVRVDVSALEGGRRWRVQTCFDAWGRENGY